MDVADFEIDLGLPGHWNEVSLYFDVVEPEARCFLFVTLVNAVIVMPTLDARPRVCLVVSATSAHVRTFRLG